jgi:hypothetical protein
MPGWRREQWRPALRRTVIAAVMLADAPAAVDGPDLLVSFVGLGYAIGFAAEDTVVHQGRVGVDVTLASFGWQAPWHTFAISGAVAGELRSVEGSLDSAGYGGHLAIYPLGEALGSPDFGLILHAGIAWDGMEDRVPPALEAPLRLELLLPASVVFTAVATFWRGPDDGDCRLAHGALCRLEASLRVPLRAPRKQHDQAWALQLGAAYDGVTTLVVLDFGISACWW